MVARVKIEDNNSHHATMFNKIILANVGDEQHESTTAILTQLLQSEKMMFKKDIITEVNKRHISEDDIMDKATAVWTANTWREDPEVDGETCPGP